MNVLDYSDVLPHYVCKHCNEVNILLKTDREVFKWLTAFTDYHKVEGTFTCKHCNKKFVYFWALATHLMMEEHISWEKILENQKQHFSASIEGKKKAADKTSIPFAGDDGPTYVPDKKEAVTSVSDNIVEHTNGERKKWTDEAINILVKSKKEGASMNEIVKRLGRNKAQIFSKISQLIKEGKLQKKKGGKISDTVFDECVEQNKKDISEDKKPTFNSVAEIAKYIGVTPWTVYMYLDKRFGKGQDKKKVLNLE